MESTSQVRFTEPSRERVVEQQPACAYLLVIPRLEGPVIETLEKFIAALSSQEPVVLPGSARKAQLEVVDSWLEHTAAAEYLGVGRSTLYRYSEHQEIESRKFCGRLQYRLSSLDEFKARHVRPSRHSGEHGAIIPSAPRSGK